MQRQLDQKFQEQEAKIKEALDGLNSRSWQLGGARTRAISEMSAKHSMGADTELGLSSSDAVVSVFFSLGKRSKIRNFELVIKTTSSLMQQ